MRLLDRRTLLISGSLAPLVPLRSFAASRKATLYKNPQCGCCEGYADYLKSHEIDVDIIPRDDFNSIGRTAGVPEELDGCHITKIDGYLIIGHVPTGIVNRLLPGMDGPRQGTIAVYEIVPGQKPPNVFATV
jgi:hypothetical protein